MHTFLLIYRISLSIEDIGPELQRYYLHYIGRQFYHYVKCENKNN